MKALNRLVLLTFAMVLGLATVSSPVYAQKSCEDMPDIECDTGDEE